MDWIDISDPQREQKIAARIAICRSFLAVQSFGPFAQRMSELGLRAKREKGAMVTYVPIVLVPRVLEILPPAAFAWVQKKSDHWMGWVEQEEERHALRAGNREALALSSGTGCDAAASSVPLSIWKDLYPYQRHGVLWLQLAQGRAILGDDMGLGKTPQALVFLEGSASTKALVIAPSSVTHNWKKEAERWAPSFHFEVVKNTKDAKKRICAGQSYPREAWVITWGLLFRVADELLDAGFYTVIADEAHAMKEITAKRTRVAVDLCHQAEHRLLLSGTPVRNRPKELWSLCHAVDPLEPYFSAFVPYGERFCGPRNTRLPNGKTVRMYRGKTRVKELNHLVRPYLLRREKKEVLTDLPPKRRQVIDLKAPERFTREYQAAVAALREELIRGEGHKALGALAAMRKDVGAYKVPAALEWLEQAAQAEEPIVVFLVHKDVRALLEAGLDRLKIPHAAIVGGTPQGKRQEIVESFQRGEIEVLIGSEAMKEGVTLTRSSYTLHIERFWVPGDEMQAEDRIYRIGQDRPVLCTYLHLDGSLDDHVAALLEKKTKTIEEINDRTPITRSLLRRMGGK
jgi:SNF2 family DNA or RNA helicase